MADELDFSRIGRNVDKMISLGAAEDEIHEYLSTEGTDAKALRSALIERRAPQQESSGWDEAGRKMALGARGVASGLASIPAMFGDAANALVNAGISGVNAAAGTDIPKLKPASQAIESLMTRAGIPEAVTPTEEILYAINRGAAGGLSVPGAAKGLAPYASQGAQKLVDTLQSAPLLQMLGGAATEGGAKALEEAGASPGLSAVGGVGLGLAAPMSAEALAQGAKGIARGVPGLMRPMTESGRERIAGEALRRGSANPQTVGDALADAAGRPELVPGSQPTSAQSVNDAGLASMERAMMNDPQFAGAIEARRAANNQARMDFLREQAPYNQPAPGGAAADLADHIRRNIAAAQAAGDTQAAAAQQALLAELTRMGQGATPEVAGRAIRGAIEPRYQAVRQATSQAYRNIDPTDSTQFDPAPIYNQAAAAVNERFARTTRGTPPDLAAILGRLRAGDLAFEDLRQLRSEAGNIAGMSAKAGDMNQAGAAREIMRAIEGGMDAAASGSIGGFTPEMREAYRNANRLRTEQGRVFEEGAVGRTMERNQFGRYEAPESAVAANFFFSGKGAPEAARQLLEAAPNARQAVQDYAVNSLRQYALNEDGSLNGPRFVQWLGRHRDALNEFPAVRDQFANLRQAQRTLDQTVARNETAMRDLQDSALGYFTRQDPAEAVATILRSKNSIERMRDLRNRIGNDDRALAALRRSVVDFLDEGSRSYAISADGDRLATQAKFGNALKAVGDDVLREAGFVPAQIRNMRAIAEDLDRASISNTAGRSAGSPTSQNLAVSSLISNITGGHFTGDSPGMKTMMKPLAWLYHYSDEEIRSLMKEAMLDPALAAKLASKATVPNVENLSRALKNKASAIVSSVALDVARQPASEQEP